MSLTIVSSLDVLSRQKACASLAADTPGALVVFHDLLENGLLVRRVFQDGERLMHGECTLEHPCLGCAVRLDLVPTVGRLLTSGSKIIVGLPPTVPAETAVHALLRGLGDAVTIDSVVLACAPDALEDQIWDRHTLFESGFTPVPEDERTPGEFLVRELSFSDTVVFADPALVPVDPEARVRGAQLVRELAPHVVLAESLDRVRAGVHNLADATSRAMPGSVQAAPVPSGPFATVVHRVERPLHPERFRQALATLAEACCWLRGRLWMASAPGCRIAVQGIGPRVWLENTGPWQASRRPLPFLPSMSGPGLAEWHPEYGDRGTIVAFTGDDLDGAEIAALLSACELTEAEMASSEASFPDPFGLNQTTETSERSSS